MTASLPASRADRLPAFLRAIAALATVLLCAVLAACGSPTEARNETSGVSGSSVGSVSLMSTEGDMTARVGAPVAEADGAAADAKGAPGRGDAGPATPGVLTAGEWDDDANWPFFSNLVSGGTISFPSYGLDPVRRVRVELVGPGGAPVYGLPVRLLATDGDVLWESVSGPGGVAALYYGKDDAPARVECGSASAPVSLSSAAPSQGSSAGLSADLRLDVSSAPVRDGLQVMLMIDTTGSMSDELAFLQADFSSIVSEVADDRVSWAASFYRDEGDEYVVSGNSFAASEGRVPDLLAGQVADGGGDTPEAVAKALSWASSDEAGWREGAGKLMFLVFDAPPHAVDSDEVAQAVARLSARGVRVVPVVASNAERDTEVFGRALALMTGGTYVFLTDDSGVGDAHLEPIVGDYEVELLHDLMVRLVREAA